MEKYFSYSPEDRAEIIRASLAEKRAKRDLSKYPLSPTVVNFSRQRVSTITDNIPYPSVTAEQAMRIGIVDMVKSKFRSIFKSKSANEKVFDEEWALQYSTTMFIREADKSNAYNSLHHSNIHEHPIEHGRARFQDTINKNQRTLGNFFVKFKPLGENAFPKREWKTAVAVVFLDPVSKKVIGRSAGYLDNVAYDNKYLLIHSPSGKNEPICMGAISSGTIRAAA